MWVPLLRLLVAGTKVAFAHGHVLEKQDTVSVTYVNKHRYLLAQVHAYAQHPDAHESAHV